MVVQALGRIGAFTDVQTFGPREGDPALAQGTIILPNAAQVFGAIGETVLPHPPEKTRRAERLRL